MRLFLKSLFYFTLIVILLLVGVLFLIDGLGWSDWAYKRFRETDEKSLILGTSRAAQGIHPDVIEKEMSNMNFAFPIYNFSFTMPSSPYGEVYYKAIEKKLYSQSYNNGLFIVTVDPWSLGFEEEENEVNLREKDGCLAGVKTFMKPNFIYLWKYARPLSFSSAMKLKDNGWLQVNVPMDSLSVKKRIDNKKYQYKDKKSCKSDYRIKWLVKTIQMLKTRGYVFLCRIPASQYFYEKENANWPKFEEDMLNIAEKNGIPYFSFKNVLLKYRTIDGQHLYKDDGAIFTKDLCDSIRNYIQLENPERTPPSR